MIGKTLGGYRIIEQIGMGGMATVYKAYDPATDRHVAVKVLPQQHAHDMEFKARFELEAKAIARLEHLHILPVFAYGEEGGTTYMVMRYMNTGTLSDVIKSKPLSFQDIARYLSQIASALDYAHSNGIVHRDVKPSNVLIDNQGNAFLTDFGIAKILESGMKLTGTGHLVGTPEYMASEQFEAGTDITPAVDQYALGVILYEMVTGQTPYQANTPWAIIAMHQRQDPLPLPHILNPNLPDAAEQVILKALAREPQTRYESCTALATAFQRAVSETPADAGAPAKAPVPRPPLPQAAPIPATMKGLTDNTPAALPDQPTGILKPQPRGTNWGIIAGVITLLLITVVTALALVPFDGDKPPLVALLSPSETPTTTLTPTVLVPITTSTAVPQWLIETATNLANFGMSTATAKPSDTPTDLPTSTIIPTLDIAAIARATGDTITTQTAVAATIEAEITHQYQEGLTATATLWTATPIPTPTMTPSATHTPTETYIPSLTFTPSLTATPAPPTATFTTTATRPTATLSAFNEPSGDANVGDCGGGGLCVRSYNPNTRRETLEVLISGAQLPFTYGSGWSPDGQYIVFTTGVTLGVPNEGFTILHRNTGEQVRIHIPEHNITAPAWSPGGEWIAFHANCNLAVSRPDGADFHILAPYLGTNGCYTNIQWSPDSQWLAASHFTPGMGQTVDVTEYAEEIHVVSLITGDVRVLDSFNLTRYCSEGQTWIPTEVTFSPDGSTIAYIDPNCEVRLFNLANGAWGYLDGDFQNYPWWWRGSTYPQWGGMAQLEPITIATPQPPTATMMPSITPSRTPQPTHTPNPTPTPSLTAPRMNLDGQANEWGDIPAFIDEQGDSRGAMDITSVQAFVDEEYLYVLVQGAGDYWGNVWQVQVEIDTDGDGQMNYGIVMFQDRVQLINAGRTPTRITPETRFRLGVLEMRVRLTGMGIVSPRSLQLLAVYHFETASQQMESDAVPNTIAQGFIPAPYLPPP